ncbi:MAG: hypothetical protein EOP00_15085 [Pedobacter sp.]|nr:MAG: hypothetical protein EOP00_15085 [Pedobacter sp.]
MVKQLLIVDNDDQSEAIDRITSLVKTKPFKIECHQFLVGLPDGNDVIGENGRIDMKLVREKFEKEFGARRFHLMAFDVKLNDPEDGVDGVELIRSFNGQPNATKTKKLLYSSELTEIVQGYLDDYKASSNYERAWEKFKTLINLEILDFCQREEYEKKIVYYIEKVLEKEDDYLLDKLRGNQDLTFSPAIEVFQGLNFGQIADKINTNDSEVPKFKKSLIELSVSYFSAIDNG